MSRRALALTVIASLCTGGAAIAKPAAGVEREAARRFARANKLYTKGDYEEALRLYQAAYDLVADTAILYNLGLAREKVFDYEGCAAAFLQYLDSTESAPGANRDSARRRLEHCEQRTLIPIEVSSFPPGAAIVVADGASETMMGRAPARLELRPGHYEIRVEMPGYVTDRRAIDVAVGRRSNADFSLERLSSLSIEADVSGAAIQIDGGEWQAAPLHRELAAGVYRVLVRKPGHRDVEREVRVESGQQKSLVVSLPALPKQRRVVVLSDVAALASIDGAEPSDTPAAQDVLAGQHRVEVHADGYIPLVADISVPDDADIELRIDLAPKRTRTQKAILWGLAGGAGASVLAGSFFGVMARSDEADYMDGPTPALLDRGERRARTADVLFGTAAVLSVTAIVYYVVTSPGESKWRVVQ